MKHLYSLFFLLMASLLPLLAHSQCDTLLKASAIDQITCENELLAINLSALELKKGGTWTSSESGPLSSTTINTKFTRSQYLIYTYANAKKTCTGSDSFFIKVNTKPDVRIVPFPTVCANAPCFDMSFNASPLGGTWSDDGSADKYVRNGKFCPGAVPPPIRQVRHGIIYTYKDANGCKDSTSGTVTIKPLPQNPLASDTVKHCLRQGKLNLDSFALNRVRYSISWTGDGVVTNAGAHYFDSDEVGKKEGYYTLAIQSSERSGTPPYCSSYDTMVVKLEDCLVSTGPMPEKDVFSVFPNPSTRDVQLSHSENFTYKVFAMNGVLVEKSEQPVKNAHLEMEEGVYWVVITNAAGRMESQKLIVGE